MDIYRYDDGLHYDVAVFGTRTRVCSNLCTRYFSDKQRFCGNYASRKRDERYQRRCRYHLRRHGPNLPSVVLVMIMSEGRVYNKSFWLSFFAKCEEHMVPIELLVYNEHMFKGTVRHHWNFISRFRPFPDVYPRNRVVSLLNSHGQINYTSVYMDMLKYVCRLPHARWCVVVTERTVPIRSPVSMYRSISTYGRKCALDVSYNVRFSRRDVIRLPLLRRNKEFQLVNNKAQGLYSVEFLEKALPALDTYRSFFGIGHNARGYTVENRLLVSAWESVTGAMSDEYWLLNSFLLRAALEDGNVHPIRELKVKYMKTLPESDNLVVAEIPEYRDGVKRTVIFKDMRSPLLIPVNDRNVRRYYKGLRKDDGTRIATNLYDLLWFLKRAKKNALFFRSVQAI